MSQKTKIEWCDATLSPWWGCTKVSDGCKNCYAETITNRFKGDHWGKGKPRLRQENFAKNALALNRKAKRLGKRLKVFPSMCDWLDDEVPIEWLADFLKVIHDTPNLDWLLLTKRPENFQVRMIITGMSMMGYVDHQKSDLPEALADAKDDTIESVLEWSKLETFPNNVWIGVSVENQEQADKRIPELLNIPAKIRFLSCEPLLGQLNLTGNKTQEVWPWCEAIANGKGINWVIVGGESGQNARPMHPDWARSIRDQCVAANVPFFFKQWGGVHKSETGRLLDGVEWNQFPDLIDFKKVERV